MAGHTCTFHLPGSLSVAPTGLGLYEPWVLAIPRVPGVIPVSSGVKGCRLSADRGGQGSFLSGSCQGDIHLTNRSGRPALLGHLRVLCDVTRRARRPSGGSFAQSSIWIWTGRPRPWDPGARPHPDLVETRTTSVPYPVHSASLLPEGHYRPNKSPNPTRRSTLPDSGHRRKRNPLLGAGSSSDPKGCDGRPISPWWSEPTPAQDRPPQRQTHPNTLWRSKASCRFII